MPYRDSVGVTGDRIFASKIEEDIKPLTGQQLFNKLKNIQYNLDDVHTRLAKCDLGQTHYSPISIMMIDLKNDISIIHNAISNLSDGIDVAQEVINEQNEKILNLEKIIQIKELERKAWADMCIKKESIIADIHANLILGNGAEAFRLTGVSEKSEAAQ